MSALTGRIAPGFLGASLLFASSEAAAHGISEASRETMNHGGTVDYIWLGAEHMVTGYDHLLFLFGVIFFLKGFRDVVRFITAFTLGHCITLLGATLAGITANAYLVDAVIALSVIYKGFENLDGFNKHLGIKAPNLLAMVFGFGLIHGFGLSTRLQELALGHEGLVSKILAFNLGVELGQIAALSIMLAFFAAWRSSKAFARFDALANGALVLAGAGLFALQIDGYMHGDHHGESAETNHHADDHGDEGHHGEDGHHGGAETPAEAAPAAVAPTEESPKAEAQADEAPAEEAVPAEEPPADKSKGHGHGHGHAHGHSHDKPAEKEPEAKPHSHGSGKPHTH